ncbi:MAG: hypothetical protein U1A78_36255 [Polyangia bacterium]
MRDESDSKLDLNSQLSRCGASAVRRPAWVVAGLLGAAMAWGAGCAHRSMPARSTPAPEARLMPTASPSPIARRGVLLEQLIWQQAEAVLRADAVVVVPLGAAA